MANKMGRAYKWLVRLIADKLKKKEIKELKFVNYLSNDFLALFTTEEETKG